jgi:hypothetical protein
MHLFLRRTVHNPPSLHPLRLNHSLALASSRAPHLATCSVGQKEAASVCFESPVVVGDGGGNAQSRRQPNDQR